MKIITRQQALAADLRTYFTGEPCLNGHIAQRYTGSKCCYECDKIKTKVRRAKPRVEYADPYPLPMGERQLCRLAVEFVRLIHGAMA